MAAWSVSTKSALEVSVATRPENVLLPDQPPICRVLSQLPSCKKVKGLAKREAGLTESICEDEDKVSRASRATKDENESTHSLAPSSLCSLDPVLGDAVARLAHRELALFLGRAGDGAEPEGRSVSDASLNAREEAGDHERTKSSSRSR